MNKIARLMTEVNADKYGINMAIYEMTPTLHGAPVIAVTTTEKFKQILEIENEDVNNYSSMLTENKYKTIILPGFALQDGVLIDKTLGHFLNTSVEEYFAEEGYVVIDIPFD